MILQNEKEWEETRFKFYAILNIWTNKLANTNNNSRNYLTLRKVVIIKPNGKVNFTERF